MNLFIVVIISVCLFSFPLCLSVSLSLSLSLFLSLSLSLFSYIHSFLVPLFPYLYIYPHIFVIPSLSELTASNISISPFPPLSLTLSIAFFIYSRIGPSFLLLLILPRNSCIFLDPAAFSDPPSVLQRSSRNSDGRFYRRRNKNFVGGKSPRKARMTQSEDSSTFEKKNLVPSASHIFRDSGAI